MTGTVPRDKVAPLMLGDLSVSKPGKTPKEFRKFTEAEAATVLEAAAIRLGMPLYDGQKQMLRMVQGAAG